MQDSFWQFTWMWHFITSWCVYSQTYFVLVIRLCLKFTAQSERDFLSVHRRCLHSFSSERWTWTSSDRTEVNVYLSPFLSSWEFALRPGWKPPTSPQCFLSFLQLLSNRLATEPTKWQLCDRKPQNHKVLVTLLNGSTYGRMWIMIPRDRALCCFPLTFFREVNLNP